MVYLETLGSPVEYKMNFCGFEQRLAACVCNDWATGGSMRFERLNKVHIQYKMAYCAKKGNLSDVVLVAIYSKMDAHTHTHTASLTIWDSSASLALQPQRRPKPGSIVEAPALLHFGRAPAHQLGATHHLVARGTALAVVDGRLPALHALTAGTRHPDPLLKTQLLTTGREGRKERGGWRDEESRREERRFGMGETEGARVM